MKFLHVSNLLFLFTLSSQLVFADKTIRISSSTDALITKNHIKNVEPAISGFSKTLGPSYIVYIPANVTTSVPISLNRNCGTKKDFVVLKENGMQILEPGNYKVNFFMNLENNESPNELILKIILKRSSDQSNQLSGIVKIEMNSHATLEVSGILNNVKKGELLSLVAASEIQPASIIQVSDWRIILSKVKKS